MGTAEVPEEHLYVLGSGSLQNHNQHFIEDIYVRQLSAAQGQSLC